VELEDVNRTALVRLKMGLEEQGVAFPFTIPPKNSRKERGVSLHLNSFSHFYFHFL
jgi:hypothetical protein